jgi:phage terminase large subunit-like protein
MTARWEQYAHASEADYFAWWSETNLIQSVGRFADKPLVLEPWQIEFMGEALAVDDDEQRIWASAALLLPRKNGKALALNTPIPTPDGWTTMGELGEGDEVFDENGDPCRVVFATDVMHDHDCYQVVFSDGTSIVADAGHQWLVHDRMRGRDIVLTTAQMEPNVLCGTRPTHKERRFSIPVAGALETTEILLPIDPYVLGAWLGDGNTLTGQLTFGEAFVADEIEACGYQIADIQKRENRALTATVYGLVNGLKALGLIGNKHVPAEYLRASRLQRLALLQGLMDTDGHIAPKGRCEFTTTKMRLAADFVELARSLGLKPTTVEGRATLYGRDCGPKWRITFTAYDDMPVFRMPRKYALQKPRPAKRTRSQTRQITDIIPVMSVPVRCIQVDAPSSLYLVGEGMVPTHNTMMLAAYALYRLLHDTDAPEVLLAASSDKQAGRLFDAVVAFVRRNADIAAKLHLRDYIGEIARADGGGKIIRMASDPSTVHGYNPSLVICDELHAWTKPSQSKTWAALTSGGGAREAAEGENEGSGTQVFTITTAGDAVEREDSILGRLLDGNEEHGDLEEHPGLRISRNWDARVLVYNHTAPTDDPADTPKMKLANPASWITEKYLAKQAANPELTNADVLQLHGCVWAAGERHWLPEGVWDACAVHRPVPPAGTKVVLGFDGSDRLDSTAIVGCTTDAHLFVVGVWERPTKAGEWKVPRGEVEARLHEAMGHWDVQMLVCDPPGWHREIEEWGERYGSTLTIMYPTNRTQLMAAACGKFFTAVVEKRLTHDGNPTLARHLANAVTKETMHGRYITKEHPTSHRKIDCAVAAIVAHDLAAQPVKPPSKVVSW